MGKRPVLRKARTGSGIGCRRLRRLHGRKVIVLTPGDLASTLKGQRGPRGLRSKESAEAIVPGQPGKGRTNKKEGTCSLVSAMQQKSRNKRELPVSGRSGTSKGSRSVEARVGRTGNTILDPTQLMERCVERENVIQAWKRVQKNGGSAGSDGMTIEAAKEYLREHWSRIRQELLSGSYDPKPVRTVEIPKPSGGVRQLGIPCVVDRLIQQCVLQILQPEWDSTFHPNSFGFRPGKSAHQAIAKAQSFIQDGRKYVVDVDIEKFFDRVNHDILMDRVAKRIKDPRVVALIRRFLKSGMMSQGMKMERYEGTPQGGPLSPLLSNLLLNEVDWELERRGLSFCRYADDLNVYVKSRRAAERGLESLGKILGKLKLKINPQKSAAADAKKRPFLGFQFYVGRKRILQRRLAPEALKLFKWRVKTLTRRTCGKSIEEIVKGLRKYIVGWKEYFKLVNTADTLHRLDGWIRRRLRAVFLYRWKRGDTCYRNLINRGLNPRAAASIACAISHQKAYWAMAGTTGMNFALPGAYFESLGLPKLGV
jgi:RNA-directed DNA polymerase